MQHGLCREARQHSLRGVMTEKAPLLLSVKTAAPISDGPLLPSITPITLLLLPTLQLSLSLQARGPHRLDPRHLRHPSFQRRRSSLGRPVHSRAPARSAPARDTGRTKRGSHAAPRHQLEPHRPACRGPAGRLVVCWPQGPAGRVLRNTRDSDTSVRAGCGTPAVCVRAGCTQRADAAGVVWIFALGLGKSGGGCTEVMRGEEQSRAEQVS